MSDYLVDERHAQEIGKWTWYVHPLGHMHRTTRVGGRPINSKMHREVWQMEYGRMPCDGLSIDHINGVKTDNRIANLRPASRKLQNWNRTRKRKHQLPRGVHPMPGRSKPYEVFLKVDGSSRGHLGYYATPEEASAVYEAALAAAIEAEAKKCWEMFWNQEEKNDDRAA